MRFVVGVAPSGANTNTVLNITGAGTLNITSTTNASFNVGVGTSTNTLGGNAAGDDGHVGHDDRLANFQLYLAPGPARLA